MEIRNVIICGLGSLGVVYANKLSKICNLKILADNKRIAKYKKNPPSLNGKSLELSYLTPDSCFSADLIIIATKFNGLDSAIRYIKNFIHKDTIVISLLNGISSEEIIKNTYPNLSIPKAFYIGHSAIRNNQNVAHDGVGKIVLEPNPDLEKFFRDNDINYELSENIIYSQWVKLGVNIILNELSAIYRCKVGALRNREDFTPLAKDIINEIKTVAELYKVGPLENYEQDIWASINLVADDGITSMYQDVLSNRETEIDIFSGEIIRLGRIYGVETPINTRLYNIINKNF